MKLRTAILAVTVLASIAAPAMAQSSLSVPITGHFRILRTNGNDEIRTVHAQLYPSTIRRTAGYISVSVLRQGKDAPDRPLTSWQFDCQGNVNTGGLNSEGMRPYAANSLAAAAADYVCR